MEEEASNTPPSSPSSGKMVWVIGGIILLVVVLGGGIFFAQKSAQTANPTTEATPVVESTSEAVAADTPAATSSAETTGKVQEITVEGKEFSYTPSSFKVKKGEKVKVTFKNVGKMQHDFVIEGLNARTKVIAGGSSDSVEFTAPDKAGSLTYFCSVGTHRKLGMEGKITIE
jgi:plastocyanin